LIDRVIVGVDDFDLHAESGGYIGHGNSLFRLVIVLSGGKSNNYVEIVHRLWGF
jgi:hypothetical protein